MPSGRWRLVDSQGNVRLMNQRLAGCGNRGAVPAGAGERLIEAAARHAKESSVANVRTILGGGDPATAILRAAHDEAADIIVMGRPRARGPRRAVAGQRLAQGDPPRRWRLSDRQAIASAGRARCDPRDAFKAAVRRPEDHAGAAAGLRRTRCVARHDPHRVIGTALRRRRERVGRGLPPPQQPSSVSSKGSSPAARFACRSPSARRGARSPSAAKPPEPGRWPPSGGHPGLI